MSTRSTIENQVKHQVVLSLISVQLFVYCVLL